jgi:hypothetical protein
VFALAHALDAEPGHLIPSWRQIAPEILRPDEQFREFLRWKITDLSKGTE